MKSRREIIVAIILGVLISVFSSAKMGGLDEEFLIYMYQDTHILNIETKKEKNEEVFKEAIEKYFGEYYKDKILDIKLEEGENGKKINIILDCRIIDYPRWGLDSAFMRGIDIMSMVKALDRDINDIDISFYETRYGGHEEIGLRCINRELNELEGISDEDYENPKVDLTKKFDEIRTDGDYWRTRRGPLFDSYDFAFFTDIEKNTYDNGGLNYEPFYKILKYYLRAIKENDREQLIALTYNGPDKVVGEELFNEENIMNLKSYALKFYEKRAFVFTTFIDESVWIYGADIVDCPSVIMKKNLEGEWRVQIDTMEVFENLEIP